MKFFPRRAALVAVAASIALVVPACSSNDEPAATTTSTESGAFPRTIEHFRGSTEIPAAPQRIVALDNSFT
ncbi:iron siderophore-binding protein, partial [Rhodococcus erythropolis]|nr:iron siderophore-binding protein [Rhodococcus erythropolis]